MSDELPSLYKEFQRGKLHELKRGETLLTTDEPNSFFVVITGYVKRFMIKNDGSIGVQSIYGPEDIFPLTHIFKTLLHKDIYKGPETYYYEAMTPVKVLSLDTLTLKSAVDKDSMIYRDLLVVAGDRFLSNIQQLENLSLPTFYHRVAHQLYFYSRQFGEPVKDGISIKIPLTQQDLADILGATRETVSICVSQLRKKGLISTGKYTIVRDIEKLQQEAFNS